jgi:hypothetical protein
MIDIKKIFRKLISKTTLLDLPVRINALYQMPELK